MINLKNVFNKLSVNGHIYTESVTGVDLFRGSDENGTGLEKDLSDMIIDEGFKFVSLDELGIRSYDINKHLKAGNKSKVLQIFKNYCRLYGVDNIFTSLDNFPPDFIVFTNSKIHFIEAKKTAKDSIRYGDNPPKPDFIYVLRDTKNNIQTFYYGNDVLPQENYDEIVDILDKLAKFKKEVLEPSNKKIGELSNGLLGVGFRQSMGSTKGGKITNPALSSYRRQREQRVLESVYE